MAPTEMDPCRREHEAWSETGPATSAIGVLGSGESPRFRRLFEAQFPFVWRTLRRLGVPAALLPDASQRVFWVAARRLEDIATESERSFLFGTARRVAADFRRLARRTVPSDALDAAADPHAPTTEDLVDQKRARELLDRLLDALEDDLREVLVLQEGEGLSLSEIAELLAIPLGTAASRLRRAREEFRRQLRRHMISKAAVGGMR